MGKLDNLTEAELKLAKRALIKTQQDDGDNWTAEQNKQYVLDLAEIDAALLSTATQILREKDVDGNWQEYALQQRSGSCGAASVKLAKELTFNKKLGEEYLRNLMDAARRREDPTLKKPLDFDNPKNIASGKFGVDTPQALSALKANPDGVGKARIIEGNVDLKPHLDSTSKNRPAVLNIARVDKASGRDTGSGHFVVCIGPSKKDPSVYIILDPMWGVQSLKRAVPLVYSVDFSPGCNAQTKKGEGKGGFHGQVDAKLRKQIFTY